MQDGVQKTASFCASLCAERVVAARREMQQRWAEERLELEKAYGIPAKPSSAAGVPGAHRTVGVQPGGASADMPLTAPQSWPDLFAQTRGFAEVRPASGALRTIGGSAHSSAVHLQVFDIVSNGASKPFMDPLSSDAVAYDSTFIDAYDAVQTLEERTNMASRAMDLLDEALQAAVGASAVGPASPFCAEPGSVHSFVSCSPGHLSGTTPAVAVCSPGVDNLSHPRERLRGGSALLSPHSQGEQSLGSQMPFGQAHQIRKSDANTNAAHCTFHAETGVENFPAVVETCQGSDLPQH